MAACSDAIKVTNRILLHYSMLRTNYKVHYEGNDRDFDTGIAPAGFARSAVINMWKPVPPMTDAGGVLRARRVETLAPGSAGDAIWWERGKVKAVGPHARLLREAPARLPRYELRDALVTPGFVDGHTHFALWALGRRRVQLTAAPTRAEAVRRVAGTAIHHAKSSAAHGTSTAPSPR